MTCAINNRALRSSVSDASRRWLIERSADSTGHQQVMELMTETVTTISVEASIAQAASQMLKRLVHRLPVVDHKERLLGILSMADILGAFVEAAPKESLEAMS